VHLIESPDGQVLLARHGLTTRRLATAIVNFQRFERRRVGTLIGINDDGFFGSERDGWRPDQLDSFRDLLLHIPWWQIHELLEAEEDETGELRYPATAQRPC
jgi:hypothetical protein